MKMFFINVVDCRRIGPTIREKPTAERAGDHALGRWRDDYDSNLWGDLR
jgi:hypothetical protein